MKTKKKTISPEALAAADRQLQEVRSAFDGVARLKPIERKRNLKLRRGGHQIVPLLAYVADKYSVMGPEISGAALSDALEYARALEPLVSAAKELLAALKDEQFHANGDLWRSSISVYGMLRKVAETHPEVATEMAPAVEWFRVRARGGKHAKNAAATVDATAPTKEDGEPTT
jgi:hypothetical protein